MAGSQFNAKKGMKAGKSGSTSSTSAMKGGSGKPTVSGGLKGSHSTKTHGAMK